MNHFPVASVSAEAGHLGKAGHSIRYSFDVSCGN